MKCVICRAGNTQPGTTKVVLERDDRVVFVNALPAQICEDCGEYYLSEDIADSAYRLADSVLKRGTEFKIVQFAA